MNSDRGFSLVEAAVAAAVLLGLTAALGAILDPSHAAFAAQSDLVDVQQRLRVSAHALAGDLRMTGAGSWASEGRAPLVYAFAPVLPNRRDAGVGDAPGTFRSDAITIVYVPPSPAQTTLAAPLPAMNGTMTLSTGCPALTGLCGFSVGDTALVFDGNGAWDTFSITAISADTATVRISSRAPDPGTNYPIGATVVAGVRAMWYLRPDTVNGGYQLAVGDGASSGNPLSDHVVGLSFEYYGDPNPPAIVHPLSDPNGPWTSYGPAPPPLTRAIPGYANGENCIFQVDAASGMQVSRLPSLSGASTGFVRLTAAQLTDGPWCPSAASAGRWDADLLRIRSIAATIRVEASRDALRGPAGVLFTRGGTARALSAYVPDQEIRLQFTPRNLNLGR